MTYLTVASFAQSDGCLHAITQHVAKVLTIIIILYSSI